MPTQTIGLYGGLVTSKDPTFLEDGELSTADNAYYEPNDPAIHKVRGRSALNATAEPAGISGVRYLQFNGTATDLFVIMRTDTSFGEDGFSTTGTYRSGAAGASVTFSDLVTGLSAGVSAKANTLDSVHYNNSFFLLNGQDRNREVKSDGTANFHGMLAASAAPTLTRDGGAGTGFTLDSGDTIEYWIEERVKDSNGNILRRSACTTSEVVTLTGDGTNDKPLITLGLNASNTDTTDVALFGTGVNVSFPVGFQISEVTKAAYAAGIEDTRTGASSSVINAPTGVAYEQSTVTIAGTSSAVSRNGAPPIAKTGDVFEDSLCLNDSTDPRILRYSWPDEPHKFPAHNFIRFSTKEQDEIRLIRRVGNTLVVCLRDSSWRVNTLPRPEDAAFQVERVYEQIDGAFGCVGAQAADTFSFGQGHRLAYIAPEGVCVTDGQEWDVLTDDIQWENEVEVSALYKAVLINNPAKYRLEAYVPLKGSTVNNGAYYLHYHPSHAKGTDKNFRAKVTGPIDVSAPCATRFILDGKRRVVTGHADGKLYLEDEGTTDASTAAGTIPFLVRTKRYYGSAGLGGQFRTRRTWVSHKVQSDSDDVHDITMTTYMFDSEAVPFPDSSTVGACGNGKSPSLVYDQAHAESFGWELSDSTAGNLAINYIAVDEEVEGYAREKGRAG